jgi:hypothetical protein
MWLESLIHLLILSNGSDEVVVEILAADPHDQNLSSILISVKEK